MVKREFTKFQLSTVTPTGLRYRLRLLLAIHRPPCKHSCDADQSLPRAPLTRQHFLWWRLASRPNTINDLRNGGGAEPLQPAVLCNEDITNNISVKPASQRTTGGFTLWRLSLRTRVSRMPKRAECPLIQLFTNYEDKVNWRSGRNSAMTGCRAASLCIIRECMILD